MPLPQPFPGLVIHYGYLWRDQRNRGLEEGVKDRPSVIVALSEQIVGPRFAIVAPITHRSPQHPDHAVEIPAATKQRLRLDDDRSWIVVTEVNRFLWPGPDLRPLPRDASQYAYGVIPPVLFLRVKAGILKYARSNMLRSTTR